MLKLKLDELKPELKWKLELEPELELPPHHRERREIIGAKRTSAWDAETIMSTTCAGWVPRVPPRTGVASDAGLTGHRATGSRRPDHGRPLPHPIARAGRREGCV